MEIERKYLLDQLPPQEALRVIDIEQGYISTDPVIRIRRRECMDDRTVQYVLTVKGSGFAMRREEEFDLTALQYERLREKCGGLFIRKKRHLYALDGGLTAEVDVFEGAKAGLILAEVEFESQEQMNGFAAPAWFGADVTMDVRYHNSHMIEELRQKERNNS